MSVAPSLLRAGGRSGCRGDVCGTLSSFSQRFDQYIDPARRAYLDVPACLPAFLKIVGRSVGVMLYQMISGRLPFIPEVQRKYFDFRRTHIRSSRSWHLCMHISRASCLAAQLCCSAKLRNDWFVALLFGVVVIGQGGRELWGEGPHRGSLRKGAVTKVRLEDYGYTSSQHDIAFP